MRTYCIDADTPLTCPLSGQFVPALEPVPPLSVVKTTSVVLQREVSRSALDMFSIPSSTCHVGCVSAVSVTNHGGNHMHHAHRMHHAA